MVGADGIGNTEVEIRPEWTKLCKIEYVATPPYPGAIFIGVSQHYYLRKDRRETFLILC